MAAPGALTGEGTVNASNVKTVTGTPASGTFDKVFFLSLAGDHTADSLTVDTTGWTMIGIQTGTVGGGGGDRTVAWGYAADTADTSVVVSWDTAADAIMDYGTSEDTVFATDVPTFTSEGVVDGGSAVTHPSASWTPIATDVRPISAVCMVRSGSAITGYPDADNNQVGVQGVMNAGWCSAAVTASSPYAAGDWSFSKNSGSLHSTLILYETVAGGTTVTPATVATVAAVAAPTVTAASTVTPALIAAVTAVAGPTVLAASTVTPASVATLTVITNPTVTAASTVTPSTVASVSTVDTPGVSAASSVTPAVVTSVVTVATPAVTVAPTVTPGSVATVAAVTAPVVLAASTVTPSTVAATFTVGSPTIDVATGTIVTPATVAGLFTVDSPGVTVAPTVNPAVVAVSFTVATPNIAAAATVTVSTVTALVGIGQPAILIAPGVTPDTVLATFSIGTPTITGIAISLVNGYDSARFFRNSASKFVLVVGLSRSTGAGFKQTEGWYPASGRFALPVLHRAAAMTAVQSTWAANTGANNATLRAAVNTQLNSAGYRRGDGTPIT